MWAAELYDDLRGQVRKASRRDLLITAGAMLGFAAFPLAVGWWLVLTATLSAQYAIDHPNSRGGHDTAGMAIYWGVSGWLLIALGLLFVAMASVLLAGVLGRMLYASKRDDLARRL